MPHCWQSASESVCVLAGIFGWPVPKASTLILGSLIESLSASNSPVPLTIQLVEDDAAKLSLIENCFVANGGRKLLVLPTAAALAAEAAAQRKVEWKFWVSLGENLFAKLPDMALLPVVVGANGVKGVWALMTQATGAELEGYFMRWKSTGSSDHQVVVLSMDNIKYPNIVSQA